MNTEKAIIEFTKIRDIPYRIPLLLAETDNCCIGKHILLKKQLEGLGYEIRYRACSFKWSNFKLPEKLQNIPHENDCEHLFLEFKYDSEWHTLDATWDHKLSPIFQVNEWDGKTSSNIVVPVLEILSVERSNEIVANCYLEDVFEKNIEINGEFYSGFNNWLESLR